MKDIQIVQKFSVRATKMLASSCIDVCYNGILFKSRLVKDGLLAGVPKADGQVSISINTCRALYKHEYIIKETDLMYYFAKARSTWTLCRCPYTRSNTLFVLGELIDD